MKKAFLVIIFLLHLQAISGQERVPYKKDLSKISDRCMNFQGMNENAAHELLQSIFGPHVTISNIKFQALTGDATQASLGSFSNGNCVFPDIDEGIVLSSGIIGSAAGPNISSNTGDTLDLPGDPDLDAMTDGFHTVDATWIEFDLVSQYRFILLNYVFGSDEYNHYVPNEYNPFNYYDIFGLFFNGENIGLIPGTNLPVSIRNVNNGFAKEGKFADGPCNNCEFFIDNANIEAPPYNIECNGFTTGLYNLVEVVPGEVNTIKFSISDVDDHYGNSWAFLSAEVIPPLVVYTTDPSEVTSRTALLGGEVEYTDDGQVDNRGIYWSTQPQAEVTGTQVSLGNGFGTFSHTLAGLEPNTTYYVVAYAGNIGETVYGEEKSFTTLAEPPVVETMVPREITPNSVMVGGEVVSDGYADITERGVLYGNDPDLINHGMSVSCGSGTGEFSVILEGLLVNTPYYVMAWATNMLTTSYGDALSFQTLAEFPVVETLPAENIGEYSATIGGEVIYNGGDSISESGVVWGSDPQLVDASKIKLDISSGPFSADINDLIPGEYYYYAAYAINSRGVVSGDTLFFQTLPVSIKIPNAFMPGSQREPNREFRATFNTPPVEFSMVIYNNWGAEIFRSNDTSVGWDGRVADAEAPAGGYVFRITYTDFQGKEHVHDGVVMLLR